LTQRSVQSFMFLCESVRDPHSPKWMEDFLGSRNQLEYHGTGASYVTKRSDSKFDGSWDSPLLEMMNQPKDVVIVSAKRRGRYVFLELVHCAWCVCVCVDFPSELLLSRTHTVYLLAGFFPNNMQWSRWLE
jgi:hypothetical protein